MKTLDQLKHETRPVEYNCLGFPNEWYKLPDCIGIETFRPMSVRVRETKEVIYQCDFLKHLNRNKKLKSILDI